MSWSVIASAVRPTQAAATDDLARRADAVGMGGVDVQIGRTGRAGRLEARAFATASARVRLGSASGPVRGLVTPRVAAVGGVSSASGAGWASSGRRPRVAASARGLGGRREAVEDAVDEPARLRRCCTAWPARAPR